MRVFVQPTGINFVKNQMEDRNFVLNNAKFKQSEVSNSDRTTFSARGKILFDMETLSSIADTMQDRECSYLSLSLTHSLSFSLHTYIYYICILHYFILLIIFLFIAFTPLCLL